jgi:DinB superfamily
MNDTWKQILWSQYAAAIEMLENAIIACPDALWGDRSRQPEFWYLAYHTLFFLDLYSHGTVEGFAPPEPFNLDEMDPAGILPPRVYTKDELLAYLRIGREKARAAVEAMTDEMARRPSAIPWLTLSEGEVILDNLRHVQHHAAQLNLILRQVTDSAPRWVATVRTDG